MSLTWTDYGFLSLSNDWQEFPTAVINSSLLAIEQFYDDADPVGNALIRQQFLLPGGQWYTGKVYKLFGDRDSRQLFQFDIPPTFVREGIVTQYVSVRIPRYTRTYSFPWNCQLWALDQSIDNQTANALAQIQSDLLTVDLKVEDILAQI